MPSVAFDAEDISDRIYALTTLLANCHAYVSSSKKSGRARRTALTWNDVAALLTTGIPPPPPSPKSSKGLWYRALTSKVRNVPTKESSGPSPDPYWSWPSIAVTGNMDIDGAHCTVVMTQNSPDPYDIPLDISIKELQPKHRHFHSLASDRWDGTFDSHAEDIFSMMYSLHSLKVHPSPEKQDHLLQFIHRRCFPKAAMRLLNGHNIWTEHPIDILEQWDTFQLVEPRYFYFSSPTLIPLLKNRGIYQCRDGTYHLNHRTAPLWISAFVEAYRRMERVLFPTYDPYATSEKPQIPPLPSMELFDSDEFQTLDLLVSCMVFFGEFVACEPIRYILNQPALSRQFEKCERRSRMDYSMSTASSLESDDFDLLPMESKETGGSHVIRYFTSICAWSSAVFQLTQRPLAVPTRATVITMTSPSKPITMESQAQIISSLSLVLESIDLQDFASEFVVRKLGDARRDPIPNASLHSEAALMALIHASHGCGNRLCTLPQDEQQHLFKSFACQESVIGSNMLCCWCCWRLQQYFIKHDSCPALHLPKTHEIILPWRPPSFGITMDFLKTIEGELLNMLKELIIRQFERSELQQTYRVQFPRKDSGVSESSSEEVPNNLIHHHMHAGVGTDGSEVPVITSKRKAFWRSWSIGHRKHKSMPH